MFGAAWGAVKLFGIWGRLKSALSALLGAAGRYPWQAALIVALLACGWLWRGNVSKERQIATMTAERVKFIDAQAEAERLQAETDHVAIDRQTQLAAQMERNHAQLETARRTAVADYVSSHRLPAKTAGGSPRSTVAADVPDNPAVALSGQADSDSVAVPAKSLDALSETELQNRERGDLLRGLIAVGLAVPGT